MTWLVARLHHRSFVWSLDVDLALKVGRVYRQIVIEYIDGCWEDYISSSQDRTWLVEDARLPSLEVGELRHGEARLLPQGHPAGSGGTHVQAQCRLAPESSLLATMWYQITSQAWPTSAVCDGSYAALQLWGTSPGSVTGVLTRFQGGWVAVPTEPTSFCWPLTPSTCLLCSLGSITQMHLLSSGACSVIIPKA